MGSSHRSGVKDFPCPFQQLVSRFSCRTRVSSFSCVGEFSPCLCVYCLTSAAHALPPGPRSASGGQLPLLHMSFLGYVQVTLFLVP